VTINDRSMFGRVLCLVIVLHLFAYPFAAASGSHASRKKGHTVWVVFFSSHDCPRCESVRELLKGLKQAYPVRLRVFDVAKEKDYVLFRRLESIHSNSEFAVPLVMVGESIIEGEDQIAAKLERTVRRLARGRGAPLPYLGKDSKPQQPDTRSQAERCPECEKKGRPPTLKEELGKMKVLFDKFF
jgi:thiol-disulfide isomerase/thioredoxin